MSIIYIEGKVGVKEFEETCQRQHPPINPQEVVFLFPGNRSHHQRGATLFTIKSGGGLAVAARLLGEKSYPVLSLPTTNMEYWSTSSQQQDIVKGAIADLYRAIGAGFSLMLPIRAHQDRKYFENGLKEHSSKFEPSFWGGIQASANQPLANHYISALDNLTDFISLPDEEKQRQALSEPTSPYYSAYLNGLQMQADDPWLQPDVSQAQSVTRHPTTPSITLPGINVKKIINGIEKIDTNIDFSLLVSPNASFEEVKAKIHAKYEEIKESLDKIENGILILQNDEQYKSEYENVKLVTSKSKKALEESKVHALEQLGEYKSVQDNRPDEPLQNPKPDVRVQNPKPDEPNKQSDRDQQPVPAPGAQRWADLKTQSAAQQILKDTFKKNYDDYFPMTHHVDFCNAILKIHSAHKEIISSLADAPKKQIKAEEMEGLIYLASCFDALKTFHNESKLGEADKPALLHSLNNAKDTYCKNVLSEDRSTFSKTVRLLLMGVVNFIAGLTFGIAHYVHYQKTGQAGFFVGTRSATTLEQEHRKLNKEHIDKLLLDNNPPEENDDEQGSDLKSTK